MVLCMNGTQSEKSSDVSPQLEFSREDEVRLIDLWMILIKRKLVVVLTFIISLALGGAIVFILPEKYEYITALEIGKNVTNSEMQLIENPATLLVKIREAYIPKVQYQFMSENNNRKLYAIKAVAPPDSQVILLKSKGKYEEEDIYSALHEKVNSLVIHDHNILLNKFRSALNMKRKELINKIDSSGINLLQKQLHDIQIKISKNNSNRSGEKFLTTHTNKIDNLELRVREKIHQNSIVQDAIDSIDMQLINLKETQVLDKTMRSFKPINSSKIMIIVLSIVIGLMVGVIAAFFVEFIGNVKKEMIKMNG